MMFRQLPRWIMALLRRSFGLRPKKDSPLRRLRPGLSRPILLTVEHLEEIAADGSVPPLLAPLGAVPILAASTQPSSPLTVE